MWPCREVENHFNMTWKPTLRSRCKLDILSCGGGQRDRMASTNGLPFVSVEPAWYNHHAGRLHPGSQTCRPVWFVPAYPLSEHCIAAHLQYDAAGGFWGCRGRYDRDRLQCPLILPSLICCMSMKDVCVNWTSLYLTKIQLKTKWCMSIKIKHKTQ